MTKPKRTYLALLAAVAGLPLLGQPVFGQMQLGTTGHALDANPQVGSGGMNQQSPSPNNQSYQNALVTGNVTGGAGFRGRSVDGVDLGVGYTDPFAFRGLLAGQGVDQFIANSTGVPTMANPMASSQKYSAPSTVYYGASNHGQPSGFQALQGNQGYVPDQPTQRSESDTRLGEIDFSQNPVLPKPNELLIPGPVDPTAQVNPSQVFAASPLYGVRQWGFGQNQQQSGPDQQSQQGQNIYNTQSPLQQSAGAMAQTTPDQSRLIQMREELNNNGSGTGVGSGGPQSNVTNVPFHSSKVTDESDNADQPIESAVRDMADSESINLTPKAGDFATGQSNRRVLGNIPVPPPGEQSAQYAKLVQSMQKYNSAHPMTDEEANREFQEILRLRQQAAVNAEHGADVLGAPPKAGAAPVVPNLAEPDGVIPPSAGQGVVPNPDADKIHTDLNAPSLNKTPSFKEMANAPGLAPAASIDSFANGIRAKGLADLIVSGEMFVQQKQYDRAIAKYNDAIEVAPNNPLILMGRANAELGGGYYAQANADLHNAIAQNPAILMGRYDLQVHLGAQPLKALTDDLKQISEQSSSDSTHAFLLAYVLYNSHRVGKAAEWLDAADKRSGGHDQAILQMKKYWNFNDESASPAVPPTTRP